MAQFITRVELHGLLHNHPSYTALHTAMEAQGFSRTIEGSNGVVYHLPPAEYDIIVALTLRQVLDKAKNAANSVTNNNAVFVSEIDKANWDGLKPV